MEIRIPIGFYNNHVKYLIWNKSLIVGEGTKHEDLWFGGYEFGFTKILGIEFIHTRFR